MSIPKHRQFLKVKLLSQALEDIWQVLLYFFEKVILEDKEFVFKNELNEFETSDSFGWSGF